MDDESRCGTVTYGVGHNCSANEELNYSNGHPPPY